MTPEARNRFASQPLSLQGEVRVRVGRKKHSAKAAAPHAAHAALDSAFEFVVRVGGLSHVEQRIAKGKSIKQKL